MLARDAAATRGLETAPGARVQGPRSRSERLLQLRLDMLAQQARRYPLPVLVSAAFLAVIVWRHVPGLAVGAWVAGLGVILTTRWIYLRRATRIAASAGTRTALRTIFLLSLANGIVTGMAVLLFFERLPLDLKAIFTMVMVCWSAGAPSANAAYSPSFYAYTIPILAPLALVWGLDATFEGVGLALLIMLFLVLQAWLADDNFKVLMRSFNVQFENERLVRKLEAVNLSKNQFIAAASHDLKQPLYSVSIQAARLLESADPLVSDAGARISNAVESTKLQLDDLLDVARLDVGRITPRDSVFNLRDAVVEALEMDQALAHAKGLATRIDVDAELSLRTDRALFGRVLRNLVHNAVKYTAAGSIAIVARADGSDLVVEVTDTGCGIPPELHDRIFEAYFRVEGSPGNRELGLGLGLSIVRGFTNLLGFSRSIVSAPGVGSTFSVRIPGSRVERAQAAAPAGRAPLPPGLRVLLVDDDARVRAALGSELARWGCDVAVARSTSEALRVALERRPQLIIADYHLAPHDTGVVAVGRVREQMGFVPALIVTGDATPQAHADAAAADLAVLDKSGDLERLRDAMASALAGDVMERS